jgi:hypothetical protein
MCDSHQPDCCFFFAPPAWFPEYSCGVQGGRFSGERDKLARDMSVVVDCRILFGRYEALFSSRSPQGSKPNESIRVAKQGFWNHWDQQSYLLVEANKSPMMIVAGSFTYIQGLADWG